MLPDAPIEDDLPPGPDLNKPEIVVPEIAGAPTGTQEAPGGATPPPAAATGTRTHIVASGDNFSTLAAKYYGDASLFGLIQKANPGVDPRRMKVGQNLVIPERPAQVTSASAAQVSPVAGPDEHIVAAGETLAKIAQDRLGAELRWEELYKLNRDVIGADPARLKVGMRLKLPK
jgi:nucleoid-associated protein YgaU